MNVMTKALTHKRMRQSGASNRGSARVGRAVAPTKETYAARRRRMLAEMNEQIQRINAVLDDVERKWDEIRAM
jgi:hypothetical protein